MKKVIFPLNALTSAVTVQAGDHHAPYVKGIES